MQRLAVDERAVDVPGNRAKEIHDAKARIAPRGVDRGRDTGDSRGVDFGGLGSGSIRSAGRTKAEIPDQSDARPTPIAAVQAAPTQEPGWPVSR